MFVRACVCVWGGGIDRKFPRKLSLEVSMNFSLELSRKLPIEIIGTYQIFSKNQPHFQLWLVFLKFSETFWNFVKLFHETFSGNFKPFQNLGNFLSIEDSNNWYAKTLLFFTNLRGVQYPPYGQGGGVPFSQQWNHLQSPRLGFNIENTSKIRISKCYFIKSSQNTSW